MSSPLFRQVVANALGIATPPATFSLTPEAVDALDFIRGVTASGPFAGASDSEIVSAVLVSYAGFLADTSLFETKEVN